MLNGSELTTAISAILIAAVCVGYLLHWLWSYLSRTRISDGARLGEMSARLHEADLAREDADVARQEAEASLDRNEAEMAEKLALMQARLDGAVEEREAELAQELAAARLELETLRDGLTNARQRNIELENELESLRGVGG